MNAGIVPTTPARTSAPTLANGDVAPRGFAAGPHPYGEDGGGHRRCEHRVVEWWLRNRTNGEITVAQAPNLPLTVFLVAWAVKFVVASAASVGTGLDVVAALAVLGALVAQVV